MTIITVGLLIVKQTVPGMEDLDTNEIMIVVAGYLVGQGIADHGKEAVKMEAISKIMLTDSETE